MAVKSKTGQSSNGSGFMRAGIEIPNRLIACVQAVQKCGKSRFILTGPQPVSVINIDDGIHRAIKEFQSVKEIYVANYRQDYTTLKGSDGETVQAVAKQASDLLERMRADYIEALALGGTVGVDGTGELYEIVRLAAFGKLERVLGREYGPVNREMKLWLDLARNSQANVVFAHRMKDEYVNDKRTGGLTIDGWKKMPYECDCTLQLWKEQKEPFPQRFHLTVVDAGTNAEMEGEDLSGEMVNLGVVGQMMFPQSDAEEWGL